MNEARIVARRGAFPSRSADIGANLPHMHHGRSALYTRRTPRRRLARAFGTSATLALLALLSRPLTVSAAAADQHPHLTGPRVKTIEPATKWGIDHRDRFPVFNVIPRDHQRIGGDDLKAATKTTTQVLLERWLELHDGVRGWAVSAEAFEDRTLRQLFPHTIFYRLIARSEGLLASRYGCVSLGVPLVLPEEINLLLVLENRRLNRYNARSLAEVLVRMVDPEGATTMNVISRKIERDRESGEMAEVVLESWSYNQGLRKRWTFRVSTPYFHSLAEKIVAYRPRVLDGLRPESGTFLDEDDYRGAESGDETYIAFWRSPEVRNRMRAIRESWLARRHGTEDDEDEDAD